MEGDVSKGRLVKEPGVGLRQLLGCCPLFESEKPLKARDSNGTDGHHDGERHHDLN